MMSLASRVSSLKRRIPAVRSFLAAKSCRWASVAERLWVESPMEVGDDVSGLAGVELEEEDTGGSELSGGEELSLGVGGGEVMG